VICLPVQTSNDSTLLDAVPSGVARGIGGQLSPGAGLRGRKIGDQKCILKCFFIIIHENWGKYCIKRAEKIDIFAVQSVKGAQNEEFGWLIG